MNYLEEHETMAVNDICLLFNVSRDTARRDIVKLAEKGAVIRTHGGIALSKFNQKIQGYVSRLENEPAAKLQIGKRAASFVKNADMIFLDVSTTVQSIIPNLNVQTLTVVTNSMNNAWSLMDNETIQTYLLGGLIRAESQHVSSCSTLKKLEDYRFTTSFLGAAGITHEGIYYCYEDDSCFKREVAKRSEQVIIVADHTKFGKYSSFKGLYFQNVDVIITDKPLAKEFQKNIENQGVQLIIVQE
jgi:DeoR/GlpR family transcriptional regulator of sugar metabolism